MKTTLTPAETEEKYQALLEGMSDGFAILETVQDSSGAIVDLIFREYNSAFKTETGLTPDGGSIREVLPYLDGMGVSDFGSTLETGETSSFRARLANTGERRVFRRFRLGGPGSTHIGLILERRTNRGPGSGLFEEGDALLHAMTEQSDLGVAFFDRNQKFTYANSAYHRMYGYKPGDMVGKRVEDLTVPEDWRRKRILLDRTLARGEPFSIDKRHTRPDGKLVWVRSSVGSQRDEHGNITGGAITSIDVTDLKIAELTRKDIEDRYKLLFNSIDHGFCVIEMVFGPQDEPLDYRFLEVNTSFEAQTGLKNAVGRTAREMLPELEDYWFEIYGRIAKTGIPERFEMPSEEMGAYYEVYAFRIGLAEAQQVGILFSNVIERVEAQNILRETEARFRQFGEASSDFMWIRNANTLEVEYLNPAFEIVHDISPPDLLADPGLGPWLEMIVPEDRQAIEESFESVREGKSVECVYCLVRRTDGQLRWVKSRHFPLIDSQGSVQRIGGIGRDITEERQTSNRLEVLVTELQHRTRNLLAVINAVAGRTIRRSKSLDEFREKFTARLDALERVNALLSRLGEGDRISFDLLLETELGSLGLDEFNPDASPNVVFKGPRGVRLRSGSVQTFALALHELMTNAVKYGALSRPEGELSVTWSVETEDNYSRLQVKWEERGAPREETCPEGTGYGRELIERALPYQLGAETSYDLQPDGLRCTIVMPISIS
ncbi:PAS domain S-box protein [Amaricoccus macauensis]|uniref:PAS domain S-box protein n=1 Tax=Amaricoccus macauensis TaxID=57001 RepID=UPI003C7BB198